MGFQVSRRSFFRSLAAMAAVACLPLAAQKVVASVLRMTPEEWQEFVLRRYLKWRRKNPKTEAAEAYDQSVISRLMASYDPQCFDVRGGSRHEAVVDEIAWEAIRDVREGKNVLY